MTDREEWFWIVGIFLTGCAILWWANTYLPQP